MDVKPFPSSTAHGDMLFAGRNAIQLGRDSMGIAKLEAFRADFHCEKRLSHYSA